MPFHDVSYSMITRQHSRSGKFAALLLVAVLLLPVEYVFGAMCPMEMGAGRDMTSDTCCPNPKVLNRKKLPAARPDHMQITVTPVPIAIWAP
jgi:hypothetical protein